MLGLSDAPVPAFICRERMSLRLRHDRFNMAGMLPAQTGLFHSEFERARLMAEGSEYRTVGTTALIEVNGVLDYKYSYWSWLFDLSSYLGIMRKVRAAAADSQVTKIVLDIDSPGGYFQGLPECGSAIAAARESKEVVAIVNPLCASAAYWLASAATRIVSIESGECGSVGAQTIFQGWTEALKLAGISIDVFRSEVSPLKNVPMSYEGMSEEGRAILQERVDEAGNQFVETVARNRGISVEQVVANYGQGRTYLGAKALEAGMIDAIGDLDSELKPQMQSPTASVATRNRSRSQAVSNNLRRLV